MDKKELRKLNNQLINAEARLERAIVAKRVAEIEVGHLRTLRDEAISKIGDQLVTPLYDVYLAGFEGTPNKINCIKAIRELSWGAPNSNDMSLREAKEVVDFAGTPSKSVFLKGVDFTYLEKARKMLREYGGIAEARGAS